MFMRFSDRLTQAVLERLPWPRVVLLGACAAARANDLFGWAQSHERIWLDRKEKRIIARAIGVANSIALDGGFETEPSSMAMHRANAVRQLCEYEAESASFDFDKVFWTWLGPLWLRRGTRDWRLSEGAYLLRSLRSEVAGAAFRSILAAACGADGHYIRSVQRSILHYDVAREFFIRRGVKQASVAALMSNMWRFWRDFLRLRDLGQDCTAAGFLSDSVNPADSADDWRWRMLGLNLHHSPKLMLFLCWPAQVAYAARCVERAARNVLSSGHSQQRAWFEQIVRMARRVAANPGVPFEEAWPEPERGSDRVSSNPSLAVLLEAGEALVQAAQRECANELSGRPVRHTTVAMCASVEALVLAGAPRSEVDQMSMDFWEICKAAAKHMWTDESPVSVWS